MKNKLSLIQTSFTRVATLTASILLAALPMDVRAADLAITEIQSSQAAAAVNDYWELTNVGTNSVDLSNWKWNDSARNTNSPAVTIPAATMIAAGESVIFTALTPAAFRTWWGISNTVQVISTGAAPGLGQNDAISLFDNTGAEVLFLSYAANGFTNSSGSGAAGGHAGASGGGSATAALVLDPTFGTTPAGRRYTAATVGTFGAFASAANPADVGSPGVSGLSSGGPTITIQPASTTIGSNTTATLTVAATGIPTPTFQWYFGNSGNTNNPVSGATSSSFTTPVLTATTNFWVQAVNSAGTDDSDTATVTVLQPPTSVDLSRYVRIGRFSLPEPTRTTPPDSTNLLCQEASGVAYNWDTDTLFIVGDGGRSVTEVSKSGVLVSTMTLALGGSPQGTDFYDPEGITYIGSGQFVFSEERDRQLVKFTYVAGTVLSRANAQTVKLGTFSPNEGTEGLSYDPQTDGFICIKEINPQGIFQTTADFATGLASNGSTNTVNSTNLFDPALLGLADLADVFALSNIPTITNQPDASHLLVLSQESAKIVEVDRSGTIYSSLQIVADPGSILTVAAQQHEGLTMDRAGILYVVNENGGGDIDHPELWVYAPSSVSNQPPTAVVLDNTLNSIAENTSTAAPIKVADITVTDDGLGANVLSLSGADAASFEITGNALFIKAGTILDYEAKTNYTVIVSVDDLSVGPTPDATNTFTLAVTDVVNENAAIPNLIISEVAPWSSGNSPIRMDWFEVSNIGTNVVDLTGWKVADNADSFSAAGPLSGVTNIAPGESVVFADNPSLVIAQANFRSNWFGANLPAGLQIGSYTGAGGLGTGGDAVNLYNSNGVLQARVTFGASPSGPKFATFDNATGRNNTNITRLSVPRVYGAFYAANDFSEIGSPGSIGGLIISEVAAYSSGSSPVGADWFEVINTSPNTVDITGWKVDDNSATNTLAAALNGITNIAPGEAVIFIETNNLAGARVIFLSNWFGANPPTGLQIGSYTGSGLGLGTGGDAVNLFDNVGTKRASVSFGASPAGPLATFDNSFGLNGTTISQLSTINVHGAFVAVNSTNEIGSPGTGGRLVISEVAPWSSSSPLGADWFEVSNDGATAVDVTGWKMDDVSQSPAGAVALTGITNIAPGESVIFIETNNLALAQGGFRALWFGANTNAPAGVQIGSYTGSGVGLGTGAAGDAVNLFNSNDVLQASISFGASPVGPSFPTFENAGGRNNTNITQLSTVGINGAFLAANDPNEKGSPGIMTVPALAIALSSSNAIARWTPEAVGYRLQESSNLTVPAGWTNVTQNVVLTNGQLVVTVPLISDYRFYRLQKP